MAIASAVRNTAAAKRNRMRRSKEMKRITNAEAATTLHHDSRLMSTHSRGAHRCDSTGTNVRALTLDRRMSSARGAPRHWNAREPTTGPGTTNKEASHDQDKTSDGGCARWGHRNGGEPESGPRRTQCGRGDRLRSRGACWRGGGQRSEQFLLWPGLL